MAKIKGVPLEAELLINGSVVEAKIGALAVTEAKLGALAVTEAKIGALAVTEAKIGALSVTEGKIGALSVTEGKIGALSVTEGKIGALAVTSAKIGALAVTTAKIAADAVDKTKINADVADNVTIGFVADSCTQTTYNGNDYFRSADASLKINGAQTWAVRAKPTGGTYQYIISNYDNQSAAVGGFAISVLGGVYYGEMGNGINHQNIPSTVAPSVSAFDTLVLTHNGLTGGSGILAFYVNGVSQGTVVSNFDIADSSFHIGVSKDLGGVIGYFSGVITNIEIYSGVASNPTAWVPGNTSSLTGVSLVMESICGDGAPEVGGQSFTTFGDPVTDTVIGGEIEVKDLSITNPKIANLAVTESKLSAAVAAKLNGDAKDSVRAVATANLDLNGAETIDSVVLATGNRVFASAQSTATQIGIYIVSTTGAWTRADDFALASNVSGAYFPASEGAAGAGKIYIITNAPGSDIVGTSTLTFVTSTIADLSVTESKLGALAVTEAKIGALAVTEGKIGALAVTEAKIGALSVTEGKIGALAVTEGKIGALAVTTAKIDNLAVTEAKLSTAVAAKLNGTDKTTSSGAGAVAITGRIHEVTTTGTGDALTLANGTDGQRLSIIYVAEGAGADTAILTPTTLAGAATTITFNNLGDTAELLYSANGGWYVMGGSAVVA